jgi:hypothetical protein
MKNLNICYFSLRIISNAGCNKQILLNKTQEYCCMASRRSLVELCDRFAVHQHLGSTVSGAWTAELQIV